MRQIKFRGWDATGQKGWVYGDLVHNQKVTMTGLEPRVMIGGYEVIPESIGQFTGILDRNGKEIYEGDKVFVSKYGVCCVKWNKGRCQFELCNFEGYYFNTLCELCGSLYEVIGNLYNNLP